MITLPNIYSLINICLRAMVPLLLLPLISNLHGAQSVTIWVKAIFTISFLFTFEQAVYPLIVRANLKQRSYTNEIILISLLSGIILTTFLIIYFSMPLLYLALYVIILLCLSHSNNKKAKLEANAAIGKIRKMEILASLSQIMFWTIAIYNGNMSLELICVSGVLLYYSFLAIFLPKGTQKEKLILRCDSQNTRALIGLFVGQCISLFFINMLYLITVSKIEQSIANEEHISNLSSIIYILRSIGYVAMIPLYNSFYQISENKFHKPLMIFARRMMIIYTVIIIFINLLQSISGYHIYELYIETKTDALVVLSTVLIFFLERLYAIFNHIKCLTVNEDTGKNYIMLAFVIVFLAFFDTPILEYYFIILISIASNSIIRFKRYGDL